MTDIEIPDIEDAACDLDEIESYFAMGGLYDDADKVSGAARRLRADAEEIARLEREVSRLKAVADHESRNVDALLQEKESTAADPLTRIAAALERPSREWIAVALTVRSAILAGNNLTKLNGAGALGSADALLAEMGER